MVHRVDPHKAIRQRALEFNNVHLRLASTVTSVDIESATTRTIDNTEYSGGLLTGANGVHSFVTRSMASDDDDVSVGHGRVNI